MAFKHVKKIKLIYVFTTLFGYKLVSQSIKAILSKMNKNK